MVGIVEVEAVEKVAEEVASMHRAISMLTGLRSRWRTLVTQTRIQVVVASMTSMGLSCPCDSVCGK